MVNEHASINYSPDSLTQFNALSQLAQQGLIPNTTSIGVPPYVRVPFLSYLGMLRFDWAQSQRSQWFVRYALDNNTTNNALVQQATLAFHRRDHALQLSERRDQQYVHLQPDVGG